VPSSFRQYNIPSFDPKTTSNFVDLSIPQSVWVNFLNEVGYNNIRILEMNFPKAISSSKIDKLFGYLRGARTYYLDGDYNKSIGECRRVIEDIPKLHKIPRDLTKAHYKQKIENFQTEFLDKRIDPRISEHIVSTARQLWSFSSNFHHNPNEPDVIPIEAKRADAEYLMNQTLDFAVYLSNIIS